MTRDTPSSRGSAPDPARPDRTAPNLAEAVALIEQLRDQLAALAEQYDEEHPGMEIVEARAVLDAADEFLLSARPPSAEPPA